MNWIFYALLAPLFYGIVNVLDKYILEKKVKHPVAIIPLYGFTSMLFGLIVALFYGFVTIDFFDLSLLLVAGILFTIYSWPYLQALLIDETSNVIPLFQLVPVFILMMSFFFLSETLTKRQILGFVLILLGSTYFMVKKNIKSIFNLKKSFWLMFLASFLYAVASILIKATSVYSDFWATFVYLTMGMGIGAFLMLISKNVRIVTKNYLKSKLVLSLITIGNILTLSAQLSQIKAFNFAPVAMVNVVGGVQPLFVLIMTTALTFWFPKVLKEQATFAILGKKIVAIVAIFLGLWVVYV